jgi:hypothetical protein
LSDNLMDAIWTILGFSILGISTFMVATRVIIPRFGSGWLRPRDRQRAIERAESLLAEASVDDDTRYQLLSRVNSLRARGAHGENWGSRVSERITVREIHEICDRIEGRSGG